MTGLVAVTLAALGAWLWVGPASTQALRRLVPPRQRRGRRRARWAGWGAVMLVAVALAATVDARTVAWVLSAAIATGTVAWVAARSRRARTVRRHQEECARAATSLALLLSSGHHPVDALRETAADADCLATAAAAAALGADVADALDAAAEAPGRSGLALVAAAWRVSEQVGAPVSGLLGEVAEALRRDREVADLVEAELASARGSSRIMAALPVVAVVLGAAVGADPLGFLMSTGPGQVLCVAGVTLTAVGVVWSERIAAAATPGGLA